MNSMHFQRSMIPYGLFHNITIPTATNDGVHTTKIHV